MDTRELYRRMLRIREVEEAIAERYATQRMRCPTHLSVGQELVGAAAGMALRPDDPAISTHRGHAHYLGKGGDLKAMLAEIYGKATGCARGRGGSMHLIDRSVGFMGTTAIVGNSIPIGVGLGLAIALDGDDRVSCVFLGDGSVEEGVFYESANFAAVRQLPVLFLCENNLYSVYSPLMVRQPVKRRIYEMVAALGLRTLHIDGDDAIATYDAICHAVGMIRNGGGPVFLEVATYRWREHCGPNYDTDLPYRSAEEFASWKARDPLPALENRLIGEGSMTRADADAMKANILAEIKSAFHFAEVSPFPDASEAYVDEYTPAQDAAQ